MSLPSIRVFVAGSQGMVGASLLSRLKNFNNVSIITASRSEVDLVNQKEVFDFFKRNKIDQVYLAAAKVGGIQANNTYPADFIYQNLMIEANVIHAAHQNNVQKLLFLGSSCIYPKHAEQPMSENSLLTGTLEPTNEPYAIAKIAGIKMCESYNRQYGRDYRSVMPTNLYGPGDNFHPENSHVIPALIQRFHKAKNNNVKEVIIWGSGEPLREFLHVDDMAAASIHIMNISHDFYKQYTAPMLSHINVGSGIDCSIRELAETVSQVVGYSGRLIFDKTKPDGAPRKLMDSSKLKELGWTPHYNLKKGLAHTYDWYKDNESILRTV